jgi:hypothetical protein
MQFKGTRTISTAAQFGVLAEPAEFQRVFLGVNCKTFHCGIRVKIYPSIYLKALFNHLTRSA